MHNTHNTLFRMSCSVRQHCTSLELYFDDNNVFVAAFNENPAHVRCAQTCKMQKRSHYYIKIDRRSIPITPPPEHVPQCVMYSTCIPPHTQTHVYQTVNCQFVSSNTELSFLLLLFLLVCSLPIFLVLSLDLSLPLPLISMHIEQHYCYVSYQFYVHTMEQIMFLHVYIRTDNDIYIVPIRMGCIHRVFKNFF